MKKCKYTHCRHESREIPDDEAVTRNGTTYYHPDCYKEKEAIDNIIQLWTDCIDHSPIYTQLRGVINNIVFKNGVSAEQLMFCLRWCINNGWKLRRPAGLYYVSKDEDAITAYKKAKTPKVDLSSDQFVVDDDMTKVEGFKYSSTKSGFNRILKK